MDLRIAGREAIVCASSRGLGRACAISLAREGVNVVLNGRDEEALAEATSACGELGVHAAQAFELRRAHGVELVDVDAAVAAERLDRLGGETGVAQPIVGRKPHGR